MHRQYVRVDGSQCSAGHGGAEVPFPAGPGPSGNSARVNYAAASRWHYGESGSEKVAVAVLAEFWLGPTPYFAPKSAQVIEKGRVSIFFRPTYAQVYQNK